MKAPIINRHHIIYPSDKQAEVVVAIYKGEHFLISRLSWRKNISKGFIKALRVWIALNEDRAKDLEAHDENAD
jgi:hypothetical protein